MLKEISSRGKLPPTLDTATHDRQAADKLIAPRQDMEHGVCFYTFVACNVFATDKTHFPPAGEFIVAHEAHALG